VTHEEHLVSDMISAAIPMVAAYLNLQPRERRLRLDGLQQIVDEVIPLFEVALFQVCVDWVSARAELAAGTCRICRARTRRETKPVTVRLKRFSTVVKVVRFRCRSCKMSWSPVRQWLGLQSGMTTAGLDRALTALSTEMSFGRTAKQMEEQHGHPVNRTLVERRTYAVGKEAMGFLAERRKARRDEVMDAVGHRQGVDRVLLQVDGGGVPVGKLERPPPGEATERTPVRNLPKGRRPKSKREVRVSMAWEDGVVEAKAVDLHIAPHNHTEVSGERLYHVTLEAGAGDNTHVHLTCDMAAWHRNQFEEQFSAQPNRSLCADFYHALEYVSEAGRCLHLPADARQQWLAVQATRLAEGERSAIVEALASHSCTDDSACVHTDRGECAVRAARRYLKKFGEYMDYPRFREEGLPIGSGAVEGRIRHLVRRRLDIPGDWREENLHPLLALISVRESGLWNTFWQWHDKHDTRRFYGRLRGQGLNTFRGKLPEPPPQLGQAVERTAIDEPINLYQELGLPTIH
jgi:hypothetical protein